MKKRPILAIAGTVLALILTACAAPANHGKATATPKETTKSAEIPDTPVGQVTQWIVDEMNADVDTDAAGWAERLTDEFQAEVSADDIAALINKQIRPARPLVATAYKGTETDAVTTIAGVLGAPFDLSVTVDEQQRISGLFLKPAAPAHTPATSMGEVTERLAALPGDTRALIQIDGETVLEADPDSAAPLGSIFKLYVLGAVSDAVQAGTITWDDELTVTDEVRSLPSGELQDAETGTKVSVREAAMKMISISDNTATDMLIGAVGRESVEMAVADMGHHDPALLRPFLTTRELFALALSDRDDLRTRWQKGDESERRAVLEDVKAVPFDLSPTDVGVQTHWQNDMEWFASASDIAAAHDQLSTRAKTDGVITEVLTKNPGLAFDTTQWPTIAFKGGSNTGVLTGSWRAVRADGSVLTVVVMSADAAPITADAQTELFGLVEDVFTLLAD